jgi:phosphohistidine swiveling domain-containing protein
MQLVAELEKKLSYDDLDIEFAFNRNDDLYLFQVRPLVIKNKPAKIDQEQIIKKIQNKFESLKIGHPYLFGKRTILAIMPDWNPAEIIGIRPKPLALSLYKELITDSTWAYQRDNYGYKNLRSFPLLIDLMGLPYIDVRVSFNSFVPKGLNPAIADKLVNYYLDRLESEPFLHDKVEFEIVFSCYTFDLSNRIRVLKDHNFNEDEIESIEHSLKFLTNNIIHHDRGLWLKDIEKIEELKKRHDIIFSNHEFNHLTKIYWLMEDCKRYGTLPFAGLARAGFIAVQLLNSMVSIGILTAQERLLFLNSLDSVSTTMAKDLKLLDREHFLYKYGHLRPGTYDILSSRYDEAPDCYFDWEKIKEIPLHKKEEFKLTLSQMKRIESLLKDHRLEHDVVGLFTFIKSAIEGREYSKFIFTKTLSDIFSLLKHFGKEHGIDLENIAYIDIQKFLKLYSNSWDVIEEIKTTIDLEKKKYEITKQLNLPPVIIKNENIEYFHLPDNKPNFVTMQSITARTVTDLSDSHNMKGSIVFIPSADPGFDWIFTHGIAGFVTTYGGVNSHMAIRAGELGIPAVIGTGEKLYDKWKQAHKIHIDCTNQRVEVLH